MSKQAERRQRILSFIQTNMPPDGYDASYIAECLGLDRANTSRELNALSRDGRLVRIAGRPVRFCLEARPVPVRDALPAEETVAAEPQIVDGAQERQKALRQRPSRNQRRPRHFRSFPV